MAVIKNRFKVNVNCKMYIIYIYIVYIYFIMCIIFPCVFQLCCISVIIINPVWNIVHKVAQCLCDVHCAVAYL